jgi:3-oxoacyl-[acyl-carrier protein] reductase
MDLGIEEKVALVTGASKGIGYGIAQALASEGAKVAVASRSEEHIEQAAATIPGAESFVHDVSDPASATDLISSVGERLGPVGILVVNTGGPPIFADALSPPIDEWRDANESLLLGAVALVQAAVPGMRDAGWGRILSVSSFVVREPAPNLVLSSSHRAGLLAALKTISAEVAGDGITINTILPGRIATDRLIENFGSLDVASALAEHDTPLGRLGTVEEIGAAAAFLCSNQAAYITGTILTVDGGLGRAIP